MKSQDWQPIETACGMKQREEGDFRARNILAWMGGRAVIAHWDEDRYAKKPRPFWSADGEQITWSRARQPTHWMPIVEPGVESKAT